MFHAVSKDACLSSEGTRSTGTDSVTPFSASQPCPRAGCYHRNFLLFLLLLFSVQCNCLEHNQLLVPRDVRPQHVIPHTSVLAKQTAMAGEGFPLSSMRIRPKAAQRGAAERLSKKQQHSNGRQRQHRHAYCDAAAMSPRAARLLRSSGANGSRGGGFVHQIKRHKQPARKTAGCGHRCPQRAARPGARKWRWRLPLIDPRRVIRDAGDGLLSPSAPPGGPAATAAGEMRYSLCIDMLYKYINIRMPPWCLLVTSET